MEFSYYAIFQYDDDGICISFPDIPSCLTCAYTEHEAENMAKEALELSLDGENITTLPIPTQRQSILLKSHQTAKKITVDLEIHNNICKSKDVYQSGDDSMID